jgi:hypothetical protein
MSLPTWMSPRMKECFGTMTEELLLYNSKAILTFTIYGVTINDADTQDQHFISADELSQDSDIISGFLIDDPELFEPPVGKAKEPVVNLTTLLEEPSVDESTLILGPIFDEIKPEDLINLEKLFGPLITTDESTNNNNGEGSSTILIQKEKDITEEISQEKPKEKSSDSEIWKNQLEKLLRRVYTEKLENIERTIIYYKIGKLINKPPRKYKLQQYKLKGELSESLGIHIGEKPFTIARNAYKIFNDENKIQQQKNPLNITQIRRMKNNEIKEFRKNL